eukprot:5093103-Ditylum_brightwellii.AAC.1
MGSLINTSFSKYKKRQQKHIFSLRKTIGRNEIASVSLRKSIARNEVASVTIQQSPEDDQQQEKRNRLWSVSTVRHRMRVAREKSLTSLYHQTEESRRLRRQESLFLPSPLSKLDSIVDNELEVLPELREYDQEPSNSDVDSWDLTHGVSPSSGVDSPTYRALMSNTSSLLSQTDRSFLKRVRTYSRGDSNGECNSASGALIDHEPRIASDESSNSFNSRDE